MKLAIVSPLPPAPTGIADYTVDVVRALNGGHSVDLFHDQETVASSLVAPAFHVSDLPARAATVDYDAVVYQMGNAPAHDFMYQWMERVPGIVVLHDLVLHHSYARQYLEAPESKAYAEDPSSHEKKLAAEGKHADYLAAIEAVYPGQGERLKDAHFNSTGDLLPFAFPLFEPALIHARGVGAHNRFMADAIREARPDLPSGQIVMPVQPHHVDAGTVTDLRARLGFSDTDVIVGSFGLITREKGIDVVARSVQRVAEIYPSVRFLLAGAVADRAWLSGVLDRTRIAHRSIVTGRLSEEDFAAAMEIAQVVVHLRYPTARETSAALLRVMAQGRPVVISDIANQSEIPDDAVVRVDAQDEEGGVARAIDGLMRDPDAAREMGRRAREFAVLEHSANRTRESYERLLKSVQSHYSRRSQ